MATLYVKRSTKWPLRSYRLRNKNPLLMKLFLWCQSLMWEMDPVDPGIDGIGIPIDPENNIIRQIKIDNLVLNMSAGDNGDKMTKLVRVLHQISE